MLRWEKYTYARLVQCLYLTFEMTFITSCRIESPYITFPLGVILLRFLRASNQCIL